MKMTRRNFLTKLTITLAGLPFSRALVWAQTKGKLGYMKIVDNAAEDAGKLNSFSVKWTEQ